MPETEKTEHALLRSVSDLPSIDLTIFKRACVLVPHPDDEAIGCGGLIAALSKMGCEVGTLLITDGSGGPDAPFNASAVRLTEYTQSVHLLGATEINRLMLKDALLHMYAENLYSLTRSNITQYRPDVILAPWIGEQHPDHAIIGRCAEEISEELNITLIAYEVWTPCLPSHVLDISSFAAVKRLAIESHVTALRYGNYLQAAMGLAQYRSLLLPHRNGSERYAESFCIHAKKID